MKVLVTGANGLLGRELVTILAESHEVHGLVRSNVEDPVSGVNYIGVDLAQPLTQGLLPVEIDAVIHLAQSSRFREFPEGARDTFHVNVSSTLDLLEYSRTANVKKFLFASTGGVYEDQSGPINEAGALIPPSRIGLYFASKLSAEMIASTYRECFDVSIMRFFFMFGPRQRFDMFLPRLIRKVLDGETIQIDSRGGIRLNPIRVKDAAALVGELLQRPSPPVLNVAGKDVVSIQEIADAIGKTTGRKVTYEICSTTSDIVADISSMLEFLPQEQLGSFHESLEEMTTKISAEH